MPVTIEARLLRLAEAATPGPWTVEDVNGGEVAVGGEVYVCAGNAFVAGVEEADESDLANFALIAALDPATVSRLARVVEAARTHIDDCCAEDFPLCAEDGLCSICAALAALDAEQEGAE